MSLRSVVALASSLALVLVACGGSATAPGSSSGSSGSSGSGGDGGRDERPCSTEPLDADTACVPGTAKAGAPITIGVAASTGCLGCFTTLEPCTVSVVGSAIVVTLESKVCKPAGDLACPAVCGLIGTTCTLPPLAAGSYTVAVTGDSPSSGVPPRELVVTADATASSCVLPSPGLKPPILDPDAFPKACVEDSDCVLVTAPNSCAGCACEPLAIAASGKDTYDAAYRAQRSFCPHNGNDPACSPCPPSLARCEKSTGTCAIAPFSTPTP